MKAGAYHVIVIGGGGTGAAIIHDLALRGIRTTLLEKGEVLCGTTGRHHGLLHSGARYAVDDREAARECIQENTILRRITTSVLELNDGLFVAIDDEDEAYMTDFLEGCEACGIPARTLTPGEALRLEPNLTPRLRAAVQVPDGTMDAWRLPLQFFSTALRNGARVENYSEVIGFLKAKGGIQGVRVLNYRDRRERDLKGDMVVNATGAWAGNLGRRVGAVLPVRPSAGVMVAVQGRLTNMAVSHLHPPGDGDVIVPQRNLSVLGTTSWTVENPDGIRAPAEDVQRMVEMTARLVPGVREAGVVSAWAAARPLLAEGRIDDSRALSRTFRCFDHREVDGVEGLISVSGGKATVLRAMAEATADLVCRKLGLTIPCRTREEPLAPFRQYYMYQGEKAG